jgi:hypothetical protein
MIIHSPFHDYYDVVAKSVGVDRGLRWFRKKQIVSESKANYRWGDTSDHIIIWFCRKVYRVVEIPTPYNREQTAVTHHHYDMAAVDHFVQEHTKHKEYEFWAGKRKRHPSIRHFWGSMWCGSRDAHRKFFESTTHTNTAAYLEQLAEEHRTPIVTYRARDDRYIINDELKQYDFIRQADPYTAYQEISMFLGGLAYPEKPIPPVSDKDMIIAKGFDDWSFRKPPQNG